MRLREGPGENPASLVSRHASHHPWLGRGGWAAAVELWLRQLSGRAAQRNRPDPVLRGAQRGRRAVGAVERVARPACTGRRPPRTVATRRARHPDLHRRLHRRRDRSHAGTAAVAGVDDEAPGVRARQRCRAARARMAGVPRAVGGGGSRSVAVRRHVLVGRGAARSRRRRADGARDGAPSRGRTRREHRAAAAPRCATDRTRAHQQHESDPEPLLERTGPGGGGRDRSGGRRHGDRAVTAATSRVEPDAAAWSRDEFVRRLRNVLERRYHHLHPFNRRMHAGELSSDELQLWVANRFYYQINIPIKDALILANCPEPEVRRAWIQRIIDHDGRPGEEGGIEAWLRLGHAMGVSREDLLAQRRLLPGVRFAVDGYVSFCRPQPWLEAVAASLTELFAPLIVQERLAAMLSHYRWVDPDGLQYFKNRLSQAPRDAEHALALVTERLRTREQQERAVAALEFKCDVLWCLLAAVERGPLPGGAR